MHIKNNNPSYKSIFSKAKFEKKKSLGSKKDKMSLNTKLIKMYISTYITPGINISNL